MNTHDQNTQKDDTRELSKKIQPSGSLRRLGERYMDNIIPDNA